MNSALEVFWLFGNSFVHRMVSTHMEQVPQAYPVQFFDDLSAVNAWFKPFGLGPVDED